MSVTIEKLLERAVLMMERIERVLPQPLSEPDWTAAIAWRYRKRASGHGVLEAVRHVSDMHLADLQEIDGQKEKLQQNTWQFVQGLPANNVLLTGSRGTG
jgi:predicted AAA+ superfamily ATPase